MLPLTRWPRYTNFTSIPAYQTMNRLRQWKFRARGYTKALFAPVTLTLTLTRWPWYEPDLDILKMYLHTDNEISRWRLSKVRTLQTNRQTYRQTQLKTLSRGIAIFRTIITQFGRAKQQAALIVLYVTKRAFTLQCAVPAERKTAKWVLCYAMVSVSHNLYIYGIVVIAFAPQAVLALYSLSLHVGLLIVESSSVNGFYRAALYAGRSFLWASVCLSVRLSVCLSVKRVTCDKTKAPSEKKFNYD